MKKLFSILLMLTMVITAVSFTVSAEATNFIPEEFSTFESNKNGWTALGGGTLKVTDNPTGAGRVLCYSDIPDKSYATPQFDIRQYVQANVKEETTLYGSVDMYCPNADIVDVITRIRTTTEAGYSKCASDGKNYCTLQGKATGLEGEWFTVSFSFDVTEEDLASTEPWNFCFDGISKCTQGKIYLDNLYIGLEEESGMPENENNGDTQDEGESEVPVGDDTNFVDEANASFESGTHSWKALGGGEVSVVDNPSGEGKVLKYSIEDDAKNWSSPQLDIRSLIQKNVTDEVTVYGTIDIYAEAEINSLLIRLRTKTAEGFSKCESENNSYCTIGNGSAAEGEWTTLTFSLDIYESDLSSTENWLLCFDGTPGGNSWATIYIDNLHLGLDKPEDKEVVLKEIPEKTEVSRFDETLIGTIRWDAFTKSTPDGNDPASQVARVLSPAKYHGQAPFFSEVNDDGTISFPEYTVETWEKEAEYAVAGGLDYFAYLWYDTGNAMSVPRKLHLESEKKDTIKMCGILETLRSSKTMEDLFTAMKDSCYLTLDGRPVVFLYGLNENDNWNVTTVKKLRQDAANAGIEKSLYIVGMCFSKNLTVFSENVSKDIDAVSWYSVSATKTAQPFSELAAECEDTMNTMGGFALGNNIDIIPAFTAGRDTRARIETGVSWVDGDPNATDDLLKPYKNRYALLPTMQELEDHMFNVISYAQTMPNAKTNIVCSYGWNEHEEGGWLCPTITVDENGNPINNDDGTVKVNTERLDALKRAIDKVKAGDTTSTDAPADATDAISPTPDINKTDSNGFNILFVIIPAVVVIGAVVAVLVAKKKKADKTAE